MSNYELVLLKNVHDPRTREIDHYIELGGYEAARKVVKEMTPAEVIETTKATGLRGRGGAGFPDRPEVEFRSEEHRQADLSLLQRR